MQLTRRALLQQAGVGVALMAIPMHGVFGQSAEFSYKYANNMPPMHPVNVRLGTAVQKILEETGGRVDIRVFPANQLGSDSDSLSQLRAGGIEFFNVSGMVLGTMMTQASISGIGFAFDNYDTVWRAMDGELGAYIRAQIAKVGLVCMEKIFDNGFRQMTSATHPIHTPADLHNFKMRVPVSPMFTSLLRALGAAPTGINVIELYTALQTGVADGQENPLVVIRDFKFYEVQKYCAITNHMWDGFWCMANRRAWNRLPGNLQTVVATHINQAAVQERADLFAQSQTLQQELEAAGMVFNTTQADDFRAALRTSGFYAEWKDKMGVEAWNMLERSTGNALG